MHPAAGRADTLPVRAGVNRAKGSARTRRLAATRHGGPASHVVNVTRLTHPTGTPPARPGRAGNPHEYTARSAGCDLAVAMQGCERAVNGHRAGLVPPPRLRGGRPRRMGRAVALPEWIWPPHRCEGGAVCGVGAGVDATCRGSGLAFAGQVGRRARRRAAARVVRPVVDHGLPDWDRAAALRLGSHSQDAASYRPSLKNWRPAHPNAHHV